MHVICVVHCITHQYIHVGGGLIFWHPKGAVIKREIESYWTKKHIEVDTMPIGTTYDKI